MSTDPTKKPRHTRAVKIGIAVAAFVGLAIAMDTHWLPRSSYPAPVDAAKAPTDLSAITQGSSWRCNLLRDGKPTHGIADYRFSSSSLGNRWESFSHQDAAAPFFDLDHATGTNQYFTGAYRVGTAGRIELGSDLAGMTPAFSHVTPAGEQAMRERHDPWLRGNIRLNRNALSGVFEVLTVRSLSNEEMSLLVETQGDAIFMYDETCRRVSEPPFDPAESIALLKQ